jgi:hypothetical protein
LVEQAIENRRVPSSNLGPGIASTARSYNSTQLQSRATNPDLNQPSMRTPPERSTSQLFNNADSFAMVFDEAWKRHNFEHPNHSLSVDEKLEKILAQVSEHPFALSSPQMSRQVAQFRTRLLGF